MADMEQPDRIFLRDHVISAEIGAFQSERGLEQRMRFNLTVDLRDSVEGVDDQVDRILSYDVLTQAIDTALADRRYDLVETLAERIAAEVLAHPRAARIDVSVEKLDRAPGALGIRIIRDAGRVAATGVSGQMRVVVWYSPTQIPEGAVAILPSFPNLPLPTGGDRRRIRLLAYDQAAWSLASDLNLEVASTRTEIEAASLQGRAVVWAPARMCFDAPEAGDTDDTLAFWLADRLGATGVDFSMPETHPLPAAPGGLTLPIGRLQPKV